MAYQIIHTTTYNYSQSVDLTPHLLRLRPRSDVFQSLHSFEIDVFPQPQGQSHFLDLEGNNLIQLWFTEPTEKLSIKVSSQVETYCNNPFNYLLEPWAAQLPILDYPLSMFTHLQPYLQPDNCDPIITQLAQEIWQTVEGNTISFLSTLNQHIHQTCQYTIRETGDPFPAGITWKQQLGSCRDLAVVWMAACRTMGLATRFVSGYQEGDVSDPERHLHAWAEVYLPGAGWRGYDPTQGLAVSDRHIALVASVHPRHAAPISGNFKGSGARSQMEYTLSVEKLE